MKLAFIDTLDMKILKVLQTDARKPIVHVAREVGANEATVRRRVKKLKREGIIERFTVVLDYHKLGRNVKAFIGLKVQPPKLKEIVDELSGHPDVQVL
ncbi:MAG: AsnC family transcriptional regulator, partial [Candidatus Korarchaeota archaeon]|nr:AsnC family transcriptional regulator [Candidatus Korarchaeota archaeon]